MNYKFKFYKQQKIMLNVKVEDYTNSVEGVDMNGLNRKSCR